MFFGASGPQCRVRAISPRNFTQKARIFEPWLKRAHLRYRTPKICPQVCSWQFAGVVSHRFFCRLITSTTKIMHRRGVRNFADSLGPKRTWLIDEDLSCCCCTSIFGPTGSQWWLDPHVRGISEWASLRCAWFILRWKSHLKELVARYTFFRDMNIHKNQLANSKKMEVSNDPPWIGVAMRCVGLPCPHLVFF